MCTITEKDIGKRVVFRSLCRWNSAKATRIIKGINEWDGPTVRFGGCSDFYVKPYEVIEIIEAGKGNKNQEAVKP